MKFDNLMICNCGQVILKKIYNRHVTSLRHKKRVNRRTNNNREPLVPYKYEKYTYDI